jgi:hypothetical protein
MGNFSRNTFNPQRRYVSVRLQQGVPLVDADWNELSDVTREETYRSVALTSADGLESDTFNFLSSGPNNPTVSGGSGMVKGRTFRSGLITYDSQPWRNPATAAADGVPVIPPLTTPPSPRTDICYLDVWEREVGRAEDPNIVNPVIGVETSVRLRREVALRVAEGSASLPAAPAGHTHVPLALVHRPAGSAFWPGPLNREDLRQVFNVASLVPAFAPITDSLATTPSPEPAWSLVARSNKLLAADLSSGFYPVRGALPLVLPSGARIHRLRVSGQTSGHVGAFFIRVDLLRFRQQTTGQASQSEVLVNVVVPSAPAGAVEPFEYSAFTASNGTEVVDNVRFSYGIYATSTQGKGAEIHGISVSYDFGGGQP